MRISVVLPVFNDAAHLVDAIDRILGQTGVDVELVVVDDGSTDGSRALARAAADRDPRIRLIELPQNGGVARARRCGVEQATSEWIWFVDSDDDWSPGSAEHLVTAAEQNPGSDVVVAAARYVFESGRTPAPLVPPTGPPVTGADAFHLLLVGRVTGHLWNKLFRRDLLLSVEFTPARVQSDLALVAQALAAADQVCFTPAHVYDYRVRPGSIITSRSSRAESLDLLAGAVESAARRLGQEVVDSDDYRYFALRYLTLSGLKDAVQGPYTAEARRQRIRQLRSRVRVPDMLLLARRRDLKRLAFAVSAKMSLPLYRKLLAAADR
ncbi:glycosyltransferase family 2 protein [Blastococcus sp. KM273129]|uniref:glycosyltransferase family 2 protein n=1 Tax=Blastococcus sp. KM273129 TaxID=2570315 RepID=UPI001F350DFD|nr:glycosyltransferase family 2 protein [Blastococcus sp. KM273129]MCF6736938.1 glycosyltransferase family 2 protein [Blastococcus sp. KM273129]